ncbi:MAG: hypothetical protein H0T04_04155 [Chloroflexi bacterium]|nr:hypothetical protein [Chloroflexota bacterium]
MTPDLEPCVRIAWTADGFDLIHVQARWRSRDELDRFARGVADAALINRTLVELRTALRREFPGLFELETARDDGRGTRVIVRFHPPPGEPNPDPYV